MSEATRLFSGGWPSTSRPPTLRISLLVLLIVVLPVGVTFSAVSGSHTYTAQSLLVVLPAEETASSGGNPLAQSGPGLSDRAYRMTQQLDNDAANGRFVSLADDKNELSLANQNSTNLYQASSQFIAIQARAQDPGQSVTIVREVSERARALAATYEEGALVSPLDRINVRTVIAPQLEGEQSTQSFVAIGLAVSAFLCVVVALTQGSRRHDALESNNLLPTSTARARASVTRGWLLVFLLALTIFPPGLSLPALPISLTPAAGVAFSALAVLAMTSVADGSTGKRMNGLNIDTAVGGFLLALILSVVYALARNLPSDESYAAYRTTVTFIPPVVAYILVGRALIDRNDLRRVLNIISSVAGFVVIVGISQVFSPHTYMDTFRQLGVFPVSVDIQGVQERTGSARVAGTTSHPIELGLICAATFFWPLLNLSKNSSRRSIVGWSAGSSLLLAGAAISLSRTALIGALLAIAILCILWNGLQRTVLVCIALAAVTVGVIAFHEQLSRVAILFLNSRTDPSIAGRIRDYNTAFSEFIDRPILGRGFGTRIYGKYNVLDNQYLLTALDAGALGLLSLLSIFIVVLVKLLRYRKDGNTSNPIQAQVSALIASTLVVMAGFATFDYLSFATATTLAFLIFGLANAVLKIDPHLVRKGCAARSPRCSKTQICASQVGRRLDCAKDEAS